MSYLTWFVSQLSNYFGLITLAFQNGVYVFKKNHCNYLTKQLILQLKLTVCTSVTS